MSEDLPDLFTYRGRSLDELVSRIRADLGDDAVIVARREARTGGFAGFFAKREIEVDVRPASAFADPDEASARDELTALNRPNPRRHDPNESDAARAFREQLEVAEARVADVVSDDPAVPQSAGDVEVADLFPGRPDPSGYGAVFDLRAPRPVDADVIPISDHADWQPPAGHGADRYERDLDAVLHAELDEVLEATPPEPREPEPEPVVVPPLADGPLAVKRLTLPPSISAVTCAPGELGPEGSAIAKRAADRMADRGLDRELADRAAAEAVGALLPFEPEADVRELVARALAEHLPAAPLRSGAATCAFIGSGGSGKTRTAARLAAAYARAGEMSVTVVALRSSDQGEELQRLLSPYDVQVLATDDVAEARGEADGGLVIVDTPAIILRDTAGLGRLAADLEQLDADEVHVTLPATMSAQAAGELLDAVAGIGPTAIVVTHCDETFQLGTLIGLSIDRDLPISYVGKGQAIDAGLAPIASAALAAELLS